MGDDLYIDGYKFVLTCFACPEQYDVYSPSGKQVAYLRLRHGTFRVACPDVGGDTVYSAEPNGDGIFYPEERLAYLKIAMTKIQEWILYQKFKSLNDFGD